jgi:hypothetical protein
MEAHGRKPGDRKCKAVGWGKVEKADRGDVWNVKEKQGKRLSEKAADLFLERVEKDKVSRHMRDEVSPL